LLWINQFYAKYLPFDLHVFKICAQYQAYLHNPTDLDNILDDNEEYYNLLAEYVHETGIVGKVFKIKCAAHTLQLGLADGLKNSNEMNVITVCRIAVKLLRKPKFFNAAREKNESAIKPRADCPTRWSSIYLMVNFNVIK
jgi:hypothetical protein